MTEADEFAPGGAYDDTSNPLHGDAYPLTAEEVAREALQKLRLHNSPWWLPEWNVSRLASEALDEMDRLS